LTVDLFENSASDTPFLSQSFAGGGTRTLLTDSASGWSDFQGVARVTMNQGTAEIDGLNIFVIQNGVGHQGPAVVPEPSTLSFALLAGIAAIAASFARRFRR
jgi:PEP-CTERM motif